LEGFNLNHNFALNATNAVDQPTSWEIRTHNINMTIANIQLTEKWSMQVGNIGYDFRNKRTTYPDIGLFRDLHCWEASFRWQPQRGTYFFTIKVKNAPLDLHKNFVDYVRICCRSGAGGAGSAHFFRDKKNAKGGPDGGDGGRGGHIILRGNRNMWTLLPLKYRKHVIAGGGKNGSGGHSSGAYGEDIILDVPLGTIAKDADISNRRPISLQDMHSQGKLVKKNGKF